MRPKAIHAVACDFGPDYGIGYQFHCCGRVLRTAAALDHLTTAHDMPIRQARKRIAALRTDAAPRAGCVVCRRAAWRAQAATRRQRELCQWVDHLVLPHEDAAPRREWTPEQKLMAALLGLRWNDAFGVCHARSGQAVDRIRAEAQEWFRADGVFELACEALDLDATVVRKRLDALIDQHDATYEGAG